MSEGMNGGNGQREPVWIDATPRPPQQDRVWVHVVLFLTTAYTTTLAGMSMSPEVANAVPNPDGLALLFNPRYLVYGLPFSMTLLTILSVHEMGHYLMSRAWQVRATLPYFIPVPSLIGTLGAVIRIKSRIPNRRALIDIGASGPLAGFVVAVVALGMGLAWSDVITMADVPEGSLTLGDSLLSAWMGQLIIGHLPEGHDVMLHPVAFAGWLGLFVTALNLFPVGQFDGGHIVYAIFGRWHAQISRGTILCIALLWALGPPYGWLEAQAIFSTWLNSRWPGWLIWIFLALVLGRRHPSPGNPYLELDPTRKWIGYLSLIIFLLCFIPRPISLSGP